MISLEQVQLLEEKVSKAIEYVKQVKQENAALTAEKAALVSKLEANQKRIDELEVHVLAFKDDQSRIEDGILAALDRLSQFEQAFESSLKDTGKPKERKPASPKETEPQNTDTNEFFELQDKSTSEEDAAAATEAELDIF